MNAPLRLIPLRGRRRQHLIALNRRWQEQTLGEEMARVNLDLTPEQRLDYMASMRNIARLHGVPTEPSYSIAWMLRLEEEIANEEAQKKGSIDL